jgi:sugar/nucleoside kinase (ribokinase family)
MIALIGNLAYDLMPGRPTRAGGGPYHGARALHRLRVPARIVARCALADRPTLLPQVIRFGTPVRYVAGEQTFTFGISYDNDHRSMEICTLGDVWRPSDVPPLPPSVRWVHVAPLSRADFPAATLAALARKYRVSFDGQGLVRAPELGAMKLDANFDPELLRYVKVLKVSDEEAETIGDPTRFGVREVIVTHGGRGSTVYVDGRREFVPAHRLPGDPTGAGDAYCTAYLVARSAGFAPAGAARRATSVVASLLHR